MSNDTIALVADIERLRANLHKATRDAERHRKLLAAAVLALDEAGRERDAAVKAAERAEARVAALEKTLVEHGRGVAEDGSEYCAYCDWPFGKAWPGDDGVPAQHRPTCILAGVERQEAHAEGEMVVDAGVVKHGGCRKPDMREAVAVRAQLAHWAACGVCEREEPCDEARRLNAELDAAVLAHRETCNLGCARRSGGASTEGR